MLIVKNLIALLILFLSIHSLNAQDTIPQGAERVVYKHSNGQIASSGYLVDGKPDGYWRTFYASGQLKSEGNRLNHELDGTWKFYDQLGDLYLEINYLNGKKQGFRVNYKDNYLKSKEWFNADIRDSVSIYFYPSGEVKKEIYYVNGEEEGKAFEYAKDGTIVNLMLYRSGVLVREQAINRVDNQGRKQGLYKSFHDNGNLATEGSYLNDLKDGYFKWYYEDGTLKKTEKYEMGVLIEAPETAKIRFKQQFYPNGEVKAEGTYRKGVKDGIHRTFDENGEVISSAIYADGKVRAEGVYDADGNKQGLWKEYYPDGTLMAEGKYKNNEKVDVWKYYFEDGSLEQIGSFRAGKPNGLWKWYYSNGQLRKEEDWLNGYRDGSMIEYDSLGNVLVKGSYRDDVPDGRWIVEINDFKAIGNYRDGLESGMWKFYYENNRIMQEGEFIDGLANGKHTSYYYNGQLKETGLYDYGLKVGTWNYYHEDGVLKLTITYKKGEEVAYDGVEVSERELKDPVN